MEAHNVVTTERPKQYCKYCRHTFDQPLVQREKKITRKFCPRCGELLWVGKVKKHKAFNS